MIRRKPNYALSLSALALGASLILAEPASARTIRVDSGDGGYELFGSVWSPEIALGAAPVLQGTLPFALDIGTDELQTGFCLRATGVTFFASGSDCDAVSTNTLEPLSGLWISNPNPEADKISEQGTITYTEGRLAAEPPFPDNPLDAPLAVRFHWNEVGCLACGTETYSFQAILIDVGNGNGDFDLEFNYDFGGIPMGVGEARFVLGSNTFSFGGPFLPDTDYDFQFRNGVRVDGSTAVPEPSTLLLLVLALLTMQTLRRRSTG